MSDSPLPQLVDLDELRSHCACYACCGDCVNHKAANEIERLRKMQRDLAIYVKPWWSGTPASQAAPFMRDIDADTILNDFVDEDIANAVIG